MSHSDLSEATGSYADIPKNASSPGLSSNVAATAGSSLKGSFGGGRGSDSERLLPPPTWSVTWHQVTNKGLKAPPPDRQSAALAVKEPYVYVFGGVLKANNAPPLYLADTLRFNTETNEWDDISTQGPTPCARHSATLTVYGDCLILFGGCADGQLPLNDLWVFDLITSRWCRVKTTKREDEPVSIRERSTGVRSEMGRRPPVLGGARDGAPATTSVSKTTHTRTVATVGKVGGPGSSRPGIASRHPHMTDRTGGGGGQHLGHGHGSALTASSPASPMLGGPAGNDWPSPRYAHTAVLYEGCIYYYGGWMSDWSRTDQFWKLDAVSLTWSEVEVAKSSPSPDRRFGHIATTYDHHMYIFGGSRSTSPTNDIWTYDIRANSWKRIEPKGSVTPVARTFHTGVVVDSYWLIHGGVAKVGAASKDAKSDNESVPGGAEGSGCDADTRSDGIIYDFYSSTWSPLSFSFSPSSYTPADSHCACLVVSQLTQCVMLFFGTRRFSTAATQQSGPTVFALDLLRRSAHLGIEGDESEIAKAVRKGKGQLDTLLRPSISRQAEHFQPIRETLRDELLPSLDHIFGKIRRKVETHMHEIDTNAATAVPVPPPADSSASDEVPGGLMQSAPTFGTMAAFACTDIMPAVSKEATGEGFRDVAEAVGRFRATIEHLRDLDAQVQDFQGNGPEGQGDSTQSSSIQSLQKAFKEMFGDTAAETFERHFLRVEGTLASPQGSPTPHAAAAEGKLESLILKMRPAIDALESFCTRTAPVCRATEAPDVGALNSEKFEQISARLSDLAHSYLDSTRQLNESVLNVPAARQAAAAKSKKEAEVRQKGAACALLASLNDRVAGVVEGLKVPVLGPGRSVTDLEDKYSATVAELESSAARWKKRAAKQEKVLSYLNKLEKERLGGSSRVVVEDVTASREKFRSRRAQIIEEVRDFVNSKLSEYDSLLAEERRLVVQAEAAKREKAEITTRLAQLRAAVQKPQSENAAAHEALYKVALPVLATICREEKTLLTELERSRVQPITNALKELAQDVSVAMELKGRLEELLSRQLEVLQNRVRILNSRIKAKSEYVTVMLSTTDASAVDEEIDDVQEEEGTQANVQMQIDQLKDTLAQCESEILEIQEDLQRADEDVRAIQANVKLLTTAGTEDASVFPPGSSMATLAHLGFTWDKIVLEQQASSGTALEDWIDQWSTKRQTQAAGSRVHQVGGSAQQSARSMATKTAAPTKRLQRATTALAPIPASPPPLVGGGPQRRGRPGGMPREAQGKEHAAHQAPITRKATSLAGVGKIDVQTRSETPPKNELPPRMSAWGGPGAPVSSQRHRVTPHFSDRKQTNNSGSVTPIAGSQPLWSRPTAASVSKQSRHGA